MITNVYGYCPVCFSSGVSRERRPNGDDTCYNGHKYPSRHALPKDTNDYRAGFLKGKESINE